MNILYVEDNAINRLIAERMLSKRYHIEAVETAADLFERVGQKKYEVFLIDLNLNDPSIDGFGVLSQLKNNPSTAQALFVAHTNYTGRDWEERCLEAGFDFFLPKPLDRSKFSSLIQERYGE